ncbi:phosphoribosyltransferase family protein [Nocardia pseudobrasiliensis]|uniref:Putative phosphoribosyltransferase n=1 Tax=Nocardia pseudobrasiliensis TaxID=45979 RepID=A0A370HR85_9NOCA|nr:phosphoribosyltransferase family protein [Nocardia pseudobrasiliensis]RDI60461.1 putative phosphoribosyltransferase [Nocardia pseudobrasiliensis]
MLFRDRGDAGRQLAAHLQFLQGADVVVLGLPCGGVPVAFEVARTLGAPLDVIVVRKLGLPYQPEIAFGAIGENGVRIVDDDIVQRTELDEEAIAAVEFHERQELSRRVQRFRRGHPQARLAGRIAVIVDDGIASGATARAACRVARAQDAARVVLAVPVAARDTLDTLKSEADQVICLESLIWFLAVGQNYHDFRRVTEGEVADLLHRAAVGLPEPYGVAVDRPALRDDEVRVVAGKVDLAGHLTIPESPSAMVIFAHASGSGRHSPRNRYLATELNATGLGTLLFDLLRPTEELDHAKVFDIGLLTRRLIEATHWLSHQHGASNLPIGYLGASTGAAAALRAAADPRTDIAAVVSRGGRPDLALTSLSAVRAPTLLIVGSRDPVTLELNRSAQRAMSCETELALVPGATNRFGEPGALEKAAELARDWFTAHLAPRIRSSKDTSIR